MSFQYKDVNVSVNNQYLMCESVNVDGSSPQKPIFSFNLNSPFDNVPTSIKNTISLSYYNEPNNEPNYSTLTSLISDITIPLISLINIGNNNITGYIKNYSLQLSPNGLVKSNTSYDVYTDITGIIKAQNINGEYNYDTTNSSGIGHYWSAQFYSGSNPQVDNKILQLQYSADIEILPIYSIGSAYPSQILINSITESLNILTEKQFNVNYTGQSFNYNRPDLQTLILSGINYPNTISIPLSTMILQESKYDITLDNIILFSNTYSRST